MRLLVSKTKHSVKKSNQLKRSAIAYPADNANFAAEISTEFSNFTQRFISNHKILYMKNLFATFALALFASFAMAQTTALTVSFKFINIVDGYDHNCKSEVSIDGEAKGTSPEVKESVGSVFVVNVPSGTHDFSLMNFAQYEGNWEEHTVENEYSIDCMVEDNGHVFEGKKAKLFVIFDIDTQTFVSWGKKLKVKRIKDDDKDKSNDKFEVVQK